MGWALAVLANALTMSFAVRALAGVAGGEMLLDFEIQSPNRPAVVVDFEERRYQGIGNIEQGIIELEPLRIDDYTVADVEEFGETLKTIMNEIREAAGLRALDDFTSELPKLPGSLL